MRKACYVRAYQLVKTARIHLIERKWRAWTRLYSLFNKAAQLKISSVGADSSSAPERTSQRLHALADVEANTPDDNVATFAAKGV